tara:strand:+ start:455 stop:826 length:372 start_codon:yes stop_codon:yes gene_type:complete
LRVRLSSGVLTPVRRRTSWDANGGPKLELWKTGETTDGKDTIGGGFRFVDEKGIPLEILVSYLDDRGMMLDWLDFFADSKKQGWKPQRTFIRLQAAVGDVYGPKFREGWEERMRAFYPEIGGV